MNRDPGRASPAAAAAGGTAPAAHGLGGTAVPAGTRPVLTPAVRTPSTDPERRPP
jgi:hypothetical protein